MNSFLEQAFDEKFRLVLYIRLLLYLQFHPAALRRPRSGVARLAEVRALQSLAQRVVPGRRAGLGVGDQRALFGVGPRKEQVPSRERRASTIPLRGRVAENWLRDFVLAAAHRESDQ